MRGLPRLSARLRAPAAAGVFGIALLVVSVWSPERDGSVPGGRPHGTRDEGRDRGRIHPWRLPSDFPLAPAYAHVYRPSWERRARSAAGGDPALGDSERTRPRRGGGLRGDDTPGSPSPQETDLHCVELEQEGHPIRPDADAAAHAAEVKAAWRAFAARTAAGSKPYCVAQCGVNKCCPSAMVGEEAFEPARPGAGGPVQPDALGGDNDVTLVTQGSVDRLATFGRVLAAWQGPVVAVFAVYNHTADDAPRAADERRRLTALASSVRGNVQILVYTVRFPPGADYYGSRFRTNNTRLPLYPVNTMRNVATDRATTNWVFHLDMDFVPSQTLYPSLVSLHLPHLAAVNRVAVVVPHFEVPTCDGLELDPPKDFADMEEMLLNDKVFPFHVRAERVIRQLGDTERANTRVRVFRDGGEYLGPVTINGTGCVRPTKRSWPWGILPTDYTQWFGRSLDGEAGAFRVSLPDARDVSWGAAGTSADVDGHSSAWEPFIIVRRVESQSEVQPPRFSEGFVGRYRNKVEFISHLRAKRFKFYTLLREFVTHVPHPVANAMLSDMQRLKSEMIQLHVKQTYALLNKHEGLLVPAFSKYEGGYTCNLSALLLKQSP